MEFNNIVPNIMLFPSIYIITLINTWLLIKKLHSKYEHSRKIKVHNKIFGNDRITNIFLLFFKKMQRVFRRWIIQRKVWFYVLRSRHKFLLIIFIYHNFSVKKIDHCNIYSIFWLGYDHKNYCNYIHLDGFIYILY